MLKDRRLLLRNKELSSFVEGRIIHFFCISSISSDVLRLISRLFVYLGLVRLVILILVNSLVKRGVIRNDQKEFLK